MNSARAKHIAILICLMAGSAFAGEAGTTWYSEYLWYGYPIAEDVLASRAQVEFVGLDLSAAWLNPIEDSDDVERFDFAGGYNFVVGDFTIRPGFAWILYSELDADDGFDVQAASIRATHNPTGLYYEVAHLWPTNGSSQTEAGQMHILGIAQDFGIVHAFGDVAYNDEFAPFGGLRIDGFSHARLGASVDLEVGPALIRPAIYQQVALDDSVDDYTVFSVGAIMKF